MMFRREKAPKKREKVCEETMAPIFPFRDRLSFFRAIFLFFFVVLPSSYLSPFRNQKSHRLTKKFPSITPQRSNVHRIPHQELSSCRGKSGSCRRRSRTLDTYLDPNKQSNKLSRSYRKGAVGKQHDGRQATKLFSKVNLPCRPDPT